MLALGQNNLYDFRLQTLTDVQQMLSQLIVAKSKMMELNIPVITKMYGYLETIVATSNQNITNKPIAAMHQSAIAFLDKDLLEIFLNDPTDQDMRDALSLELTFVSAATRNLVNIHAYSEEEMISIVKGKQEVPYDDLLFIYTLRDFIESSVSGAVFSALVKSLPAVEKQPDNMTPYFWDEAFMLSIILHSVWRHYFLLSDNEKLFLLQNYFYQSIVLGIPVRLALSESLKRDAALGKGDVSLRFTRETLFEGKETIPTTTMTRQGRKVSVILKEYNQKSATEQISTLIQEKYIADIYRGQEDSIFFSEWLREALIICSRLKTGDILKS